MLVSRMSRGPSSPCAAQTVSRPVGRKPVVRVDTHVIKVHQDGTLWPLLLQEPLRHLIQTLHLVLRLLDDPLQRSQVARRRTLVQQIDVDVLGDGKLSLGDRLEQRALSAAVLAKQAVPPTVCELEG